MSSRDPYFQFPLSLLQTAKDTRALIQDACSISMLTYGESLDDDARQQAAEEYAANHPGCEFPEDDADCVAIAAAAERMNVNVGNVKATAVDALKLQCKFGGGMQVRLRTDIAWSAHDDLWPLLKLKTLCGVYAGIGNRHAQRLNHRLLCAYCSGHSSPKGLKQSQLMPTSTLRYWLEQLWFSNLFQFCLHGQERWYSKTCKDDRALAVLVKSQRCATKQKKVMTTNDV